jgi:hypothetical protein
LTYRQEIKGYSVLNEKEWMKEVKKRLEKEIFFKDMNLSFYDGKKLPYSFEIIRYKTIKSFN